LVESSASYQGREYVLMLPEVHDVVLSHIDKFEDEDERQKAENAAIAFRPILSLLSRVMGRRVEMEMAGSPVRSPFPADDPVIRILAGANPPGDQGTEYKREVFGLPLDTNNYWVLVRKSTRGRGVVVSDGQMDVAQIIGHTVYPLIPLISCYHHPASKMIFGRFIALVGSVLRDMARGKTKPFDEQPGWAAIQGALSSRSGISVEFWEKRIQSAKDEIDRLRKRMVDQYRLVQDYQAIVRTFNVDIAVKAVERSERDVRQLRRHKLVHRLYACDEGIHIDTRPLVAEHDGVRYLLGTFTIRLGSHGDISVWGLAPAHLDGVPHPHLPKDGTPCFGTATEPIAKAGAELRLQDAVTLVLRWLQDGYTPQLAEHAIEQWPKAIAEGVAP